MNRSPLKTPLVWLVIAGCAAVLLFVVIHGITGNQALQGLQFLVGALICLFVVVVVVWCVGQGLKGYAALLAKPLNACIVHVVGITVGTVIASLCGATGIAALGLGTGGFILALFALFALSG